MAENIHNDAEDHDPTVHHEESDVNVAAIMKFIVAFVVLAAVLHIGLWFLFDIFRGQERKKDVAQISEVPGSLQRQFPPEPRLQPFPQAKDLATEAEKEKPWQGIGSQVSNMPINNPKEGTPVADMVKMDREQLEELHSYGVVDKRQGVFRIPIDDAKRLLLARGVPVRQEPTAGAATGQTNQPGTVTQTETPSGRSNTIGAQQVSPVPAAPRPVEAPRSH